MPALATRAGREHGSSFQNRQRLDRSSILHTALLPTLYSPPSALYSPPSALYSLPSALYSLPSALYSLPSALTPCPLLFDIAAHIGKL